MDTVEPEALDSSCGTPITIPKVKTQKISNKSKITALNNYQSVKLLHGSTVSPASAFATNIVPVKLSSRRAPAT